MHTYEKPSILFYEFQFQNIKKKKKKKKINEMVKNVAITFIILSAVVPSKRNWNKTDEAKENNKNNIKMDLITSLNGWIEWMCMFWLVYFGFFQTKRKKKRTSYKLLNFERDSNIWIDNKKMWAEHGWMIFFFFLVTRCTDKSIAKKRDEFVWFLFFGCASKSKMQKSSRDFDKIFPAKRKPAFCRLSAIQYMYLWTFFFSFLLFTEEKHSLTRWTQKKK